MLVFFVGGIYLYWRIMILVLKSAYICTIIELLNFSEVFAVHFLHEFSVFIVRVDLLNIKASLSILLKNVLSLLPS